MNYIADIRGDSIFKGFEPAAIAPPHPDERDLNLSSDHTQEMVPSIISNDVIQGDVFLPGRIFVFGGFVLRANSLGHLEQVDSYAPGH